MGCLAIRKSPLVTSIYCIAKYITMPRLSLYRPEKTADFKFIDRTVYEMFQVGGVDVYVHKYKGTEYNGDVKDHTQIQDLLFLENRDRKYEADIYTLRGHYQTQDIDFNLSQFGLFLQNDTVFLTIHINNSVDLLGRKIMPGDVLELPNLREEYAFDKIDPNNFAAAIKKFYVVEDVNRAAEGFSATWYPHLYRLKLKPIVDSQEFKDILDRPEDLDSYAGDYDVAVTYYPGQIVKYNGDLFTVIQEVTGIAPPDPTYWKEYTDNSIRDLLSTYEKEMQINTAVVSEAEADAALSGFETSHFYTLAVNDQGQAELTTVDTSLINVADSLNVSQTSPTPMRDGYKGYLLDDGIAPNAPLSGSSAQFGFGIQFPVGPASGDTFLRTDFLPNRLFRFDGSRWVKQEDNVRMTLSNTDDRQTLKTGFINNNEMSGITRLASDVIRVDLLGNSLFESNDNTVEFQVTDTYAYVLTNVAYNADYKVEVWLNEQSRATNIKILDSNGALAFTINHHINDGSRIRWTIFDKVVEQRQPLSKALKKFKPEADE